MPKTKKPKRERAPRARPHLIVTVPPEVREAVRGAAQATGRKISHVVEEVLRAHFHLGAA